MAYRLPAVNTEIGFDDLASNGGGNSFADLKMSDFHGVYQVSAADPDSINEFWGKCACWEYEVTGDAEYEGLYSYQQCNGVWSYNNVLGLDAFWLINAIYGTVSTNSGYITAVAESTQCDT